MLLRGELQLFLRRAVWKKKKSDLNVHACSSLDALLSSVRPLLLAGLEVLEMMP